MYPVSAGFTSKVKGNRELTSSLTINGVTFTGHLFSIELDRLNQQNGKLVGNAVPQGMVLLTDTAIPLESSLIFSITLGIDTVPFAPMTVTECDYDEKSRRYTVKAHDALYFATNRVASANITITLPLAA